jgi:hypothetical protein
MVDIIGTWAYNCSINVMCRINYKFSPGNSLIGEAVLISRSGVATILPLLARAWVCMCM